MRLAGGRLRSDISFTVFVSDPATYEGGRLVIVVGNQRETIKGAPGDAVVYPSTTLREVLPARSGERLVVITFIESLIADQHQRRQVYELNEIAERLRHMARTKSGRRRYLAMERLLNPAKQDQEVAA